MKQTRDWCIISFAIVAIIMAPIMFFAAAIQYDYHKEQANKYGLESLRYMDRGGMFINGEFIPFKRSEEVQAKYETALQNKNFHINRAKIYQVVIHVASGVFATGIGLAIFGFSSLSNKESYRKGHVLPEPLDLPPRGGDRRDS